MQDQAMLREVAKVLANIKDPKVAYDFLFAILTPRERHNLGLRWRLVCLLREGVTQRTIARMLGVSLCKITRGSRELKKGPKNFRKVVDRELAKSSAKKRRR
jgi:TrpR family trp operon transcriptional repressor